MPCLVVGSDAIQALGVTTLTLLAIVVDTQSPIAGLTLTEGIFLFLIGTVIQAIVIWATNKANAAEWKGAANEKFDNIETKFQELDKEQNDQWREIRKTSNAAAKLDGEFSRFRTSKH